MGKKIINTMLRYRGSRDGWMAADFHRLCDGLGSTAVLFKIKENGNCVGGFTSAKWASTQLYTCGSDSKSKLFNLTTQNNFKNLCNIMSILNCEKFGPCFGEGELRVDEPFNRN